jgi:serine/threonine-protein kinase RsbW
MARTLTLSIANRISELPRLAEAMDDFLHREKVSHETIETVQLALDELVANMIQWGHDDGREHPVRVEATVDRLHVRIVLEDDGREFDPASLPPPDVLRPPEERAEGGLGVYLVHTTVDELSYERRDGRNTVEVKVATRQLRLCPPTSVLLLVDVVRQYPDSREGTLLPYARSMAQQTAVLKERACQADIPVVYLDQSDNRWKPSFSRQVRECLSGDGRGCAVVRRLKPGPTDVFMLREGCESLPETFHRLLAKLRTTTLIVAGLADSICALVAANDVDFAGGLQLIVPRDCIAADGVRGRRKAIEQIGLYAEADFRPSSRLVFTGEV